MPVDHRLGLDQATKLLSTAGLEPDLSHDQLRRISELFEARRQWSNTYNLAGPKARTDPWNIDLIDAYALSQLAEETDALVDVGTVERYTRITWVFKPTPHNRPNRTIGKANCLS